DEQLLLQPLLLQLLLPLLLPLPLLLQLLLPLGRQHLLLLLQRRRGQGGVGVQEPFPALTRLEVLLQLDLVLPKQELLLQLLLLLERQELLLQLLFSQCGVHRACQSPTQLHWAGAASTPAAQGAGHGSWQHGLHIHCRERRQEGIRGPGCRLC
ncbi:hypothetical protein MC885_016725, partial [Smutsia gigantea]